MGRSEECAQQFAPQSHIHSGLNQQDPISSDVFLVTSTQTEDGGLSSPVKGVNLVFLWVISSMCVCGGGGGCLGVFVFVFVLFLFFCLQADFCFCFRRVLTSDCPARRLAL